MTDFWTDRNVLITGCCGWLGSVLCRTLADRGAAVVGLDRVATSAPWRAQGLDGRVRMHQADVALVRAVPGAEVIFHLAGQAHVGACQAAPVAAFHANVRSTLGVLEACRQYVARGGPLQAIVVASSDRVYAGGRTGRRRPYAETDALEGADAYSATKACADQLARMYAVSYWLPVAVLRHANVIGPYDPEPSRLVPSAILRLLAGQAPIIRSDGSPVKSYLYLDDVIAAYLRLAELVAGGLRPEAVNAAPEYPVSVRRLVEELIRVSGVDVEPQVTGEDLSQQGYWEALDSTKFRGLGWKPMVSLSEGLARTWAWYRDYKGMAWLSV